MAKIARTPFNAARWLTEEVSSSTTITKNLSGYCIFVTVDTDEVTLTVNHLIKGSYMKIILTDTSSHKLNVALPAMEGVAIYDNNGASVVALGGNGETQLELPLGATGGTYIDLICDGEKWYIQAMTHNVVWEQS